MHFYTNNATDFTPIYCMAGIFLGHNKKANMQRNGQNAPASKKDKGITPFALRFRSSLTSYSSLVFLKNSERDSL